MALVQVRKVVLDGGKEGMGRLVTGAKAGEDERTTTSTAAMASCGLRQRV